MVKFLRKFNTDEVKNCDSFNLKNDLLLISENLLSCSQITESKINVDLVSFFNTLVESVYENFLNSIRYGFTKPYLHYQFEFTRFKRQFELLSQVLAGSDCNNGSIDTNISKIEQALKIFNHFDNTWKNENELVTTPNTKVVREPINFSTQFFTDHTKYDSDSFKISLINLIRPVNSHILKINDDASLEHLKTQKNKFLNLSNSLNAPIKDFPTELINNDPLRDHIFKSTQFNSLKTLYYKINLKIVTMELNNLKHNLQTHHKSNSSVIFSPSFYFIKRYNK